MVTHFFNLLLAQQATPKPTLPEPVRFSVYMALLAIVLLGMLLIVGTLLGGHWVRRWGDRRRRPSVPPDVIVPREPDVIVPRETEEREESSK